MMKRFLSLLLAGAALFFALSPVGYALTPELDIISDTYCVMDAASGQVLIERGMNKQKAPASITKILTVALALDRGGNPDDRFVLDYKTCHSIEAGSTHVALTEGEEISLKDALMATMVMSANDAANAVAQYSAGDMDSFIPLMNQKLQEIGAKDTHFVNPNGLDVDGHYTTAYDMCLITQWAMTVPGFQDYYGAVSYNMAPTNKQQESRPFSSRHNMLLKTMKYYYEGSAGGKLGYTYNARHTIVTTAKRGNLTLICVAMDSPSTYDKYKDSHKLLDYCFENFGTLTLQARNLQDFNIPILDNSGETIGRVAIKGEQDIPLLVSKGTEIKDLNFSYDVPENYITGEEITPTITITDQHGAELYHGPLSYKVSQSVGSITKDIWKGQTFVYPFKETALLILKWAGIVLGAGIVLLFIARFFIRRHYKKLREKRRRRKIALRKRRQAALKKQRQQARQTGGLATYDNVTYWPGVNPDQWSGTGGRR